MHVSHTATSLFQNPVHSVCYGSTGCLSVPVIQPCYIIGRVVINADCQSLLKCKKRFCSHSMLS